MRLRYGFPTGSSRRKARLSRAVYASRTTLWVEGGTVAKTDVRTAEPSGTQVAAGGPREEQLQPRGRGHLWKRLVLGPALPTAQLKHERLGKPTALAVFASDNLSSVAYATEEILKVAVPAVGVLAFSVVMPITFGILAVLAIVLFSYRQTIRAYPSAGGAYIV